VLVALIAAATAAIVLALLHLNGLDSSDPVGAVWVVGSVVATFRLTRSGLSRVMRRPLPVEKQ
jgi:hypothetical protein